MKHIICFDSIFISKKLIQDGFKCTIMIAFLIILSVNDIQAAFNHSYNILPPVAVCKNISVQLGTDGTVTITGDKINNGSYDPDGIIVSLVVTPGIFNCSNVGANSVVLTVTDNEGLSSTCNAIVTVEDKTPPEVNVKPFELVLGSSGTATLQPADINNGTTDNCGSVTLSLSQTNFTCSDLGEKLITLTATDSHGNSSSRNALVTVSSTLEITGTSLSTCDLSPSLALFEADVEGGNGTYSYFWKGLDETTLPFMIILPFPPSLVLSNTSELQKPFFNNTMEDGVYDIRLVITDGNGCKDTSEIKINKSGLIFDNVTMRYSEACEGDIRTYSVTSDVDATYSWTVFNGTISSSDQNKSSIEVAWDTGVTLGVVSATLVESNTFFPGDQCESFVIDTVTISNIPVPSFISPALNVCSGSGTTYTLSNTFEYNFWKVTGGTITDGGEPYDNFVTVNWGTGPSGSISVAAGNNPTCTGFASINISIFKLSGSITSITNITCYGGSDGSVSALAAPGTGQPPYSYAVDGGTWQPGGTFNGLTLGNHVVTIRDNLLCTFDISFVITQPVQVTGTVSSQTNVSCLGGSDGSVTIAASGGTPPYQYRLNGGAYQDQNIFIGLSAGSYTITIRDSHLCTGTVPVSITQPAAILNGTASVTNVNCFGGATGSIDLTVSGGTSPYTFLWSNAATTEDILNVPAGNYSVVITDAKGCTTSVSASVTQPAAGVTGSTTVVNLLCFGAATGSINLTVTGGTSPYTFLWSNSATTEDISNLAAGTYTVTITDINGCTTTSSGTVTGPSSAVGGSVTSQDNVLCKGGNTGSVTVTGTGGTGPYEYRLGSGAFQSSGTFGTLVAGSYSITIRDANLCTFPLLVSISEPATLLGGTITSVTDAKCFGEASGSVTITASGGTSPYQFSIDGGSYQLSGIFSNLPSGPHTVMVRDNNLCTFGIPFTISQPSTPVSGSVVTQTNVNCFGALTGSVIVAGSGGTSPYTYSVDGGAFQASGTFSTLGAGLHNFIVRDINLCQFSLQATITQPASALSVTTVHTNISCFGETTGTGTASASGGTPPYTYSWNTVPVQTNSAATGLPAGTYTVTVTDQNGCIATSSITVTQPAGALTASVIVTDVACFGGSTGSVDLTVSNGTAPLTYNWSNGASTEDLTGIPTGTYSVTVTDGNGCTANASGSVDQPAQLQGSISVSNINCFGSLTGSINLTVAGGTQPYSFLWTNSAVTEDIINVGAGNYSVTVTDSNGCTVVVNGTVTQPALQLAGTITSQSDVTDYGGNDGSVTVAGSGGDMPYEYSINGGTYQTSGTFSSLIPGTYTLTVRDASSAIFSSSVTITEPSLIEVSVSGENILCSGDASGSATVSVTGGVAPYSYSWNTTPVQTSSQVSDLPPGVYEVLVTDNSGCTQTGTVTITEPPEIILLTSVTDASCPDSDDGSIVLTIAGGVGPYNIIWSDGVLTQSRANLAPDTYSVVVTDQNLCAESLQEEIDFTVSFDCLVIPQLITPNSDGYNDEWIITNIDIYPDAEILIYNRWGKLVFRTKNLSANPWDGTDHGKPVPTDSYHYILYLNDGSGPRSGVISVIR